MEPTKQDAPQPVLVLGYGVSGGSAVVDWLREFDGTFVWPVEHRLVKDPDGFMDLESMLYENPYYLKNAISMHRFLSAARFANRTPIRRVRRGLDYSGLTNGAFWPLVEEFVRNITTSSFEGHSHMVDYLHDTPLFLQRLGIGRSQNLRQRIIQVEPSRQRFRDYVATFHRALFSLPLNTADTVERGSAPRRRTKWNTGSVDDPLERKRIVLPKVASPDSIDRAQHFFDNPRIVVVDRDPRDMYAQGRHFHFFPSEVDEFIRWYQGEHREPLWSVRPENVIYIRFEDWILHHEDWSKRLKSFLGLNEARQRVGSRFDPSASRGNVGRYEAHVSSAEVAKIEHHLKAHLYVW